MKLIENTVRKIFHKLLLFIFNHQITYTKVNITIFYVKTIIKDVFYHNYSFNTKLTLLYMIIIMIMKAKRGGIDMR